MTKFLDEDGREMSREEVEARGYGHLLPDPVYLVCSGCGRRTWDVSRFNWGARCGMRQPDGTDCQGTFWGAGRRSLLD